MDSVLDYQFNFPATKFSIDTSITMRDQAEQIAQEAAEAFSAAEQCDYNHFVIELLDVIHACETALYTVPIGTLRDAKIAVLRKNNERSYYSEYALNDFYGEDDDDDDDEESDLVNHPNHYTQSGIECIDIIEKVVEGLEGKDAALLANVIKYCHRAGKKDDAKTDLEKANNYAHRLCTGKWRWQD